MHFINRVYIDTPKNNIISSFEPSEDVIEPLKIKYILDNLVNSNFLRTQYQSFISMQNKIQQIHRIGFYLITNKLEMFKNVTHIQTKDEMIQWLHTYWNTKFVISNPLYYHDMDDTRPFIFSMIRMKNEYMRTVEDILNNGCYNIGNGLILALSLNSLKIWKDDIFKEALSEFLLSQTTIVLNLEQEWIYDTQLQYNNGNIFEHPFMYAFQYCSPCIYQQLYHIDLYDYGSVYICIEKQTVYVSNIFTSLKSPTVEQYHYLKKIKYFKKLVDVYPRIYNHKYLQRNINEQIENILNHSSVFNNFIKKGYVFNILKHTIYYNRRIGILRTIQSLCFHYKSHKYSVRKLTKIWRVFLNMFPKDSSEYIWIYLQEYIYFMNHHYKIHKYLILPPTKWIRDMLYINQQHIDFYQAKPYKISLTKHFHIPDHLYSIRMEKGDHYHYFINISINTILKYIPDYKILYEKIINRHLLPLKCMYHTNYPLYQIMSKFYKDYPNETWKKI